MHVLGIHEDTLLSSYRFCACNGCCIVNNYALTPPTLSFTEPALTTGCTPATPPAPLTASLWPETVPARDASPRGAWQPVPPRGARDRRSWVPSRGPTPTRTAAAAWMSWSSLSPGRASGSGPLVAHGCRESEWDRKGDAINLVCTVWLASNPGIPRPDFISQPWRKIGYSSIFLQGCEIKSGRGRPGFEATVWCCFFFLRKN